MFEAVRAIAAHYVLVTPPDGVPYWDTGAPGLAAMPRHREVPADPERHEPVDSSAAAMPPRAACCASAAGWAHGEGEDGRLLFQAGLTVARTLFAPPYLSEDPTHQGLLLHRLPPPERVGLRPAGPEDPPAASRRGGRLPRGSRPSTSSGSPSRVPYYLFGPSEPR
ncbi:MAG: hypothetical protein U0599_14205 [Vicinamibacteria bacterium]